MLNPPLFSNGAQPYRGSIEAGYAGIAHFFSQHPNPWGWNPFFYCGLPSQFVYLPVVPYTVALMEWARPSLEPLHAYRIVVALLACLGPVTLFLFAARAGGSRGWALVAALGYTLCSPSYDLFQAIDKDRGLLAIPWRLHVMVKYGEGPHNAGLTLIPLALLAVWLAMEGRRRSQVALAAAALAVVALTHWIAAFALALACLLLMAVRGRRWPLLAAGAMGYLFAAFWLTPTFVRTVAFNWPRDSFGFQMLTAERTAMALITALLVVVWWLMRRMADAYLRFVTLAFLLFAAICEGHYGWGVDAIPEARRYALEMELFLALAAPAWFRHAWQSGNRVNRLCVVLCAAAILARGVPQAARFALQGYDRWRLVPKQETVEHKLASWLEAQHPVGRVYVSGGLRFRLNSWFPMAQVLGTFDSGLRNRTPLGFDDWFRKVAKMKPGREGEDSIRQLRLMGVEYVVIHGPRSKEFYRDTRKPERFEGVLAPAFRLEDDWIYRVPFQSLAYAEPAAARPKWIDPEYMEILAANPEPREPMDVEWTGNGTMRLRGPVAAGRVVQVLVSHSPGWRATQNGTSLKIERDLMGFLRVHAQAASNAEVVLEYHASTEQKVCAAVSGSAILAALGWIFLHRRVGNREAEDGI